MLMTKIDSRIQTPPNRIGYFVSDDKANVAPMTALCAIPLIMAAGFAIDFEPIVFCPGRSAGCN